MTLPAVYTDVAVYSAATTTLADLYTVTVYTSSFVAIEAATFLLLSISLFWCYSTILKLL